MSQSDPQSGSQPGAQPDLPKKNTVHRRWAWSFPKIMLATMVVGMAGVGVRWVRSPSTSPTNPQPSNYARYLQADLADPIAYEFREARPDLRSEHYHPVAQWSGRLILPTQSQAWPQETPTDGQDWVWLELHHAPASYQAWIGQLVRLRWTT
ncbi:MAG: hypothetical protein AB4042_02350, partial [Leptolyngbyaceae cyanobacterium]